MSELLRNKLGASTVNILNASGKDVQQSVFHYQIHVVPRYQNDGLDLWYGKSDIRNVYLEGGFNKLATPVRR